MAQGIAASLHHFARSDSKVDAIKTAERWHAAIEEMAEVATKEQAECLCRLNAAVSMFLETVSR